MAFIRSDIQAKRTILMKKVSHRAESESTTTRLPDPEVPVFPFPDVLFAPHSSCNYTHYTPDI